MNYTEFTGKTIEEAIETGLKELGISKDQADIRIVEEGKKKLFGTVKARVEIAVKEENKLTDGERTVVFLEGLFKLLNIDATTELVCEGDKVEINVTADNTNSVIGKRGATLDAIQTLAGAVANTGREDYKRVVVDCENYRENREVTLSKLAENLAQKAIRLGKKIKLEPMNPYERRIIHSALSEREGVKTESEGKEPNRYIVVIPDNLEDPTAEAIEVRKDRDRSRNDRRGGYSRDRRNNSRGNYGNKGGRKFKRDGASANSGGTSLKNNDFFGIFLGNSGNKDE